jgi:hypothetical protein
MGELGVPESCEEQDWISEFVSEQGRDSPGHGIV